MGVIIFFWAAGALAAIRPAAPWVVGRDLFALDAQGDQVVSQKPNGEWATVFRRKGCGPVGLTALSEGELAMTCEREKSIVLFSVDGKVRRVVKDNQDGEDLVPPQHLSFDSQGGLFVTGSRPIRTETTQRNGRLYWIPPGQQNAWAISTSLGYPQGVLVERDGKHVVIAERAIGRVMRYELHGSSRGFSRRLRKPRVLFDFAKALGLVPDVLSPGPAGLAWATETSLWVVCVGDARVREVSLEGQILREFEVPGKPGRVDHVVADRTRKVLWVSTENGVVSVPIPATPNIASP